MVSDVSPPRLDGGPAEAASGSLLAGYRLEKRIGTGGMAVVYRAYDRRLQRRVALKVMSAAAARNGEFRVRFLRESRAAAAVDDPHIIPVYEAGEADGSLFIAMRYVAGGDVQNLVREAGALSARRAMAIISPVALALDAAHAAGLVHRDVKPANILIDTRPGRPDHVYLSDFGLSKRSLASRSITSSGHFLGTVGYCAPEQMQDRPTDGRADQYALACTAVELLTGSPPFPREQVTAIILAHVSEPPPSLAALQPGFPPAADAVLARALAKAPGDRYASCADFADALRSALGVKPYDSGSGENPLAASPAEPGESLRRRPARHVRSAVPRPLPPPVVIGRPRHGGRPGEASPAAPHASARHGTGIPVRDGASMLASEHRPAGAPQRPAAHAPTARATGGRPGERPSSRRLQQKWRAWHWSVALVAAVVLAGAVSFSAYHYASRSQPRQAPSRGHSTKATITDGMRDTDILALLARRTGRPLSQFESAARDTAALGLPSWAGGNPEGFLYPDTYTLEPGEKPLAILQAMVKEFNAEAAKVNLVTAASTVHYTPYQILIGASLLEGEVGPQYFGQVARVIDNRINTGMPLQLDSTIAYAMKVHTDNLTDADHDIKSPYNTFTNTDLPPTPIDSPDIAAITAFLHPPHGDWLYFVTVDKKGTTDFTDSSSQFHAFAQLARQNGVVQDQDA